MYKGRCAENLPCIDTYIQGTEFSIYKISNVGGYKERKEKDLRKE
jgi:hypothetical protein